MVNISKIKTIGQGKYNVTKSLNITKLQYQKKL